MKTHVPLNNLLASMLVIAACSQSPMVPAPSAESLWSVVAVSGSFTGVSGSSNADVYVLAVDGTLLHHDGTSWSPLMPFDSALGWMALWCASPRDIFAVGYSRTFTDVYHFDGSVASPMNLNLGAFAINDLWGGSENNVYAVGKGGLVLHYDGSSWRPMESGTTNEIWAIWGFPTGELFAVLNHSVLYYDGTSWATSHSTTESLWDIWGSSAKDVYAVGENGTVLHYDGQDWTQTDLAGGRPDLDIVFGFGPNDVYTTSEHSLIYHFDGANWSTSSVGDENGIECFWGSSGTDVYAVGYGNSTGPYFPSIQHFDGASWKVLTNEHLLPSSARLTAISGYEHRIYVAGVGSEAWPLFHQDEASWKGVWGGAGPISDIWVGPARSLVVVVGSRAYADLFDESGSLQTVYFSGLWSGYGDVWASDLRDVFLVGTAGHIAHFDGEVLQAMESPTSVDLHDVWGRAGTDVYAVGNNGTVVHYDGESWQPMQSNTTENLTAVWGNAEMAVAVGSNGAVLHCKEGQWVAMSSPTLKSLTSVWGSRSIDIYAAGPRVVLHYDGSRWNILSDALGGTQIWGRAGDGLYMLGAERILRYGPLVSAP